METKYFVDGRALKTAMTAAGFDTYESLAAKASISPRTISSVANGKNPTYPIMCKIVHTLNLSAEQAGKIFFSRNLRVA